MPNKTYILNKTKYNSRSTEKLCRKYAENEEFREKAKQRSKEQYKLKLGEEILKLKEEKEVYEDELNTVHGEYMNYKKLYEEKCDKILMQIKNINDKIKEIRKQSYSNENSDTESIGE